MVAQLMLVLTAVFIIIAVSADKRSGPSISSASWIPFFWIVLSLIRPINSFLYPSLSAAFQQYVSWEQGTIDLIQSNPLERNIRLALMLVGLIVIYKRRDRLSLPFRDNRWLILFYLYAFASLGWAGYPGIALKRWIRLAGDSIVAILLLTEKKPSWTFERVIWRISVILLPLSLLFVKFYDRLGRIYTPWGTQMWVGVTGHKNALGEMCAYVGIILLWRCLKKWPKVDVLDIVLLATAAFLTFGSKSSTSAIVFMLGGFFLAAQFSLKGGFRKINRIVVIALLSLFVIQILAIAFLNASLAPLLFAAAGRDSSFTGRVPLWQEMMKIGLSRPIQGFGFTSFWLDRVHVTKLWDSVRWTPTTAHNGYIEVFIHLGLVGLFLLLLLLAQTYTNIGRAYEGDPHFAMLKVTIFTMIVLHNFTEATLAMPNAFLWELLLVSAWIVRTRAPNGPSLLPEDGRFPSASP